MTNIAVAESRHDRSTSSQGWSERLFYSAVMALMVGSCGMLFAEIITLSSSLDSLLGARFSDTFILISRLAAGVLTLLIGREVVLAFLAFGNITSRIGEPAGGEMPTRTVSIIVPAYDEGSTIEETLGSLAALDYPVHEIIVVDDGSSDDTLARARAFAAGESRTSVKVLTQPNSGKWKALNSGIAASSGELVLCVDSDSILKPDALRRMVPHFQDPSVAAVSGQVQVRNKETMIARLQALEYIVANGGMRVAQSGDGCVLIVPGPIGLFRRSALDEVCRRYYGGTTAAVGASQGPFSPHTFAEDFELSVMVCAMGKKIVYEPKAKSLTRVPDSTRALLSQRYRWLRGSMQVVSRFRGEGWSRQSNATPIARWMLLAAATDLYIVPVAGLLLLATMVGALTAGNLGNLLTLWVLVWAVHGCAAIMFLRAQDEDIRLCLLTPLQSLYNAVLLSGVWSHAFVDHVARRSMKW